MSGQKRKKFFLSVFVFEEAEEVKIWWNWGIQCRTSFARPWVLLQSRWMRILSHSFSFVCRQWTLRTLACKVRLLARMLVPPQDFPFLASWGMVIKNIWRSKRCKVEHNTNSADKIFCGKEIAAVYIQTFSKLLVFCPLNDNTATDFCTRIVGVSLFQVIRSHCCGKLNHAYICQYGGDFNT